MDYYATYHAEIGSAPFVMGGDSAGGGLTAALAQMARDSAQPLPAGLLLICPWLNLYPAHPDQLKTEPRDGITGCTLRFSNSINVSSSGE